MTLAPLTLEIRASLERLRTAADAAYQGWQPEGVTQVTGGATRELKVESLRMAEESWFVLPDLELEPASEALIRVPLTVPDTIGGVPMKGEPLGLVVNSLNPFSVTVDGDRLLGDDEHSVAVGPVDTTVLEAVNGGTPTLDMRLFLAAEPAPSNYLWFNFTTPGLRARFDVLDLAWARLYLASSLAQTEHDRDVVRRAAALVPTALEGEAHLLTPLLDRVGDVLEPLADRAEQLRVHCIGHSHTDLAYLWTWEEAARIYARDMPTFAQMMKDYPEMCMTASQPVGYDVVRDRDPATFAQVRDLIGQGRWEAATAQWVETDTTQIAGESLARQFSEGVWWSRQNLGTSPEVVLAPDTFGHSGNLPQLAAAAGARYYYHHRANPGERATGEMWPAYWWEGDDGTRILGLSTPHYGGSITAGKLAESARRLALGHGHDAAMMFFGVSNHGGGPTRASLDALRRLGGTRGLPQGFCSTVAAFGREVSTGPSPLPVHRGESPRLFEGCYTTRPDVKQRNRDSENALLTAEALAALAGLQVQQQIDEGWRQTMFHQFHDIIAGTAVADAFTKNVSDAADAGAAAETVTQQALAALTAEAAPGDIVVTNPIGCDRTDVVEVEAPALAGAGCVLLVGDDGATTWAQPTSDGGICFLATVPAFGTRSYRRVDSDLESPASLVTPWPEPMLEPYPSSRIDASRYVRLETDAFIAVVRRDSGIICSLLDRRVGRELVGFGMRRGSDYFDTARADLALGVYQLLEEDGSRHVDMSGWHLDEVHREHSLLSGAEVEVVEDGPVRCVLTWTHRLTGESSVTTWMTAYRELPHIDYRTSVDWQERATREAIPNLKVSFCAEIEGTTARFETPFGNTKRAAAGLEVPALRWAAAVGGDYGMALLNNGRSGHDAMGSRLRLTLARASSAPDPDSGRGRHETRFALLPLPGAWDAASVTQAAAGFNQPLIAQTAGDVHAPSSSGTAIRPHLEGDTSVVITAFKRARAGAGHVLRLAEVSGTQSRAVVSGLPADATVWDCDLTEQRRTPLTVLAGSVQVPFHGHQVRTLLVEAQSRP
jgi:alpha-mannosidase